MMFLSSKTDKQLSVQQKLPETHRLTSGGEPVFLPHRQTECAFVERQLSGANGNLTLTGETKYRARLTGRNALC